MMYRRSVLVLGVTVMAPSVATLAQQAKQNPERRENILAAVRALGLSQGQVAQIREIRRERASEELDGRQRRAWRQGQAAKLLRVLTEEQKPKLAEIKAAGSDSPEFMGAESLGLLQRRRQNRPPR